MNKVASVILLSLGFTFSSFFIYAKTKKPAIKSKALPFLPSGFRADFTQEFESSLSGKIKKSYGFIEYEFPGKIRFEVEKPNNTIFVSNTKDSWYYTPPFMEGEAGQVTISSAGNFPLSHFFDALKKGMRNNKYYKVNKLMPGDYELSFSKKASRDTGVAKAVLRFKGKKEARFSELESIQLSYMNKKTATIKLSKIQRNPKFKASRFDFKIPKNTKISR